MACLATASRGKSCKDSVGGLKNIYFMNYGDAAYVPVFDGTNTDVLETLGTVATPDLNVYKYELNGVSNFEQTIVASKDNGTVFFEGTLSIQLAKLTLVDHKELAILVQGNPRIIVEDQNSNFFLMGLINGCDADGGTIATGSSMGDLSGYSLVFKSMERQPANFLEATTEALLSDTTNGMGLIVNVA
ncbi:MAG: hypothetical protein HRU26_10500 [Psychroserpens sp.]|nr:hypothetical protein [Psychroserpens sp.]